MDATDVQPRIPMLQCRGVTVRFGGLYALSDVDIDVQVGEIVGLIGPNGAGKSTLMECISGFQPVSRGQIYHQGRNLLERTIDERAELGIGRTLQNVRLFPYLTVVDNVRVALHRHQRSGVFAHALRLPAARDEDRQILERAQGIVNLIGMDAFAEKFASELSYGTLRLLELGCMLALEPSFLLLDEPASGISQGETEALGPLLLDIKARTDATILIIEHDMPLIMSLCDRVYCLEAGENLSDGTPDEITADERVIEAYLGTPAEQARVDAAAVSTRTVDDDAELLLDVSGIDVFFDKVQVLYDVDFQVRRGERVALLGTNGAGKSTILKAASGLVPTTAGTITWKGEDINTYGAERLVREGLGQVPGGRGLFPTLTVEENLRMGGYIFPDERRVDQEVERVVEYFPWIPDRANQLAGTLSGGEQQQLATARGLIAQPELLMIDELSLGLAPLIIERLMDIVQRLVDEEGLTVVVVEQQATFALGYTDRAYFMEKGEVRYSGPSSGLTERADLLRSVFLAGASAGFADQGSLTVADLFSYVVIGTTRGLIYGILALGLVLIYKGTRVLNLAQPYFGLFGAFVCWWLTAEAGFLPFEQSTRPRFMVALVLTLVIVGLQAAGLERALFRRLRRAPRLVTLVATLAIGQGVLGLVVVLFERNQDQAEQLRVIPTVVRGIIDVGDINLTGGDLQVLALVPLVALELALFFRLSRFGVAIRAAAENSDSARLLGISVDRVASFSWISGLVLSALAGILLASSQGTLAISTLSTGFLVRALAAALIGGLTSLPGALAGGLIVGIGEAVISGFFRDTIGAADLVFFVAVVIMLIVRPQGLFGEREDTEDKVAFVPALRDLPERLATSFFAVATRRIAIVTFTVFAVAVSLTTGSATNGTLTLVCITAMVGVSLTVLMGYTGQISLGHWALVGVGAFAAANLHGRIGVPFLLTVPLVVAIGMLVSLLIGIPALRIKGLYLAVVTLTFSYAAELYVFRSELVGGGQTGQPMNIPELGPFDLDAPSNRPLFAFALVMLLASIWVARNLLDSRTGRTFLALRENEKAAATLGVSLTMARLTAFAISGGIAALAGVVFALRVGTVNATDFPTELSLVVVLMVMIGGLGALSGSFLGAFVVFGIPFLFQFDNVWIIPIGTGILSIEVIVRTRGGLAGLVQRARSGVVTTLVTIDEDAPPSASSAVDDQGAAVPAPG